MPQSFWDPVPAFNDRFTVEEMNVLVDSFQQWAAEALSCGDTDETGLVKPKDILVNFLGQDWRNRRARDLQIALWATSFADRVKDFDERNRRLCEHMRALLPPDVSFYVWINPGLPPKMSSFITYDAQ